MAGVALLAAGGLWLGRASWRTHAVQKSSAVAGFESAEGETNPGQKVNARARLAPPDPARRFRDFTPEQRVEFARQGHGPGG